MHTSHTPINDAATAFAAIALAAVSWDGVLTQAGTRALRHTLDYRHPFSDYSDERMVRLMDQLLLQLRRLGPQHLMVEAAAALNADQRSTAFAVAAEIMPGLPPAKAMTTAMQKEAYNPTRGSTPAMMENAMASGMSANATTRPASRSLRILENHS